VTELVLRPDQHQVKSDVYQAIREGHKAIVVQAMTAWGKTAFSAQVIKDALSKGVEVLFVAPLITLIEQTIEEFYKFGISDIGVIQADHPLTDFSRSVQICSIQSIRKYMKQDPAAWERFQSRRLVIIDEVHVFHKAHELMLALAAKPVIGLSASPWRKGLGKHFSKLICGPDTGWLIDNGFLAPYRAYSHFIPNMKGVKVNAGEYSAKESGEKYDAPVIGDIVRTWFKLGENRKTILFAPRVVDAERFAREFMSAGVSAVAVSGYMDNEDAKREIERFKSGEVKVICSVAKLATGFSVRDVGCIIDAQPTYSPMRFIQKIGRGLRTHPDKEDVIILDNAGNLVSHGLPDSEFPKKLCDGSKERLDKPKADKPEPKPCPKCNALKPPKTRECPACGFIPERQSQLEVENGELVEIAKSPAELRQRRRNKETSWEDKVLFAGMLKTYALRHGYKEGWRAYKYKERFGVWPNDPRVKDARSAPLTSEIESWITAQNIRHAKRKQK